MSLVGIRNSRSPEKPTTSASTLPPPRCSIRHTVPSGSFTPTVSMTSPATRVSLPRTSRLAMPRERRWHSARKSLTDSAKSDGLEPVIGAAQRREQASPARGNRDVDLGLLGLDQAAPGRDGRIRHELAAAGELAVAEEVAHELDVRRIQHELDALCRLRQLFQRRAHDRQDELAPHRERFADELAREHQREVEH